MEFNGQTMTVYGSFTTVDTGGDAEGAVLYTEQSLTPEQQAQARENIGAAAVGEAGGTEVNLDEYVKKTDFATETVGGVVMVDTRYGTRMVNGILDICAANNTSIDDRVVNEKSLFSVGINTRSPIVPSNVDYAVKKVLSDCKVEWSDNEKAAARELIGAADIAEVKAYVDETILGGAW